MSESTIPKGNDGNGVETLRGTVNRLNARLAAWKAATDSAKGPSAGADGVVRWPAGRTVPREVRELATELLVTLGLPAAVECLVDENATHAEKRAFVGLLKDLGVGDAVSLARDNAGDDVPGIAFIPALDPRPSSPPAELLGGDGDVGPAVPASTEAQDLARELGDIMDDRRLGRVPKGNGNGKTGARA